MSSPIKLARVRKEKARTAKRRKADANAVKYGRTKAEKQADQAANDKVRRDLDGHLRE